MSIMVKYPQTFGNFKYIVDVPDKKKSHVFTYHTLKLDLDLQRNTCFPHLSIKLV